MDLELFNQSLLLTARLVDRGDYNDALIVLRPWLDTDLSDGHKMIVCINLAAVSAMLGQEDAVLAWYDHGIWYEASDGRLLASENKAAFLANNGRKDKALRLYEQLLTKTGLTEEERSRIEHNLAVTRKQ